MCFCILLGISLFSCKKESLTDIDISTLNPDDPLLNTELDQWLKKTFLDEYNVDVIYRYQRYNHEADRNITPPKPENVKQMMTAVLEGYIMPYRKIAGETFIKRTVPKQWVLYGSTSYDGSGTGYAGTASGGVRVNLFGLNHINPSQVGNQLGTIHHEFTHILNQIVPMPTDFPLITPSTYKATWKDTPLDSAHKWGYVSSYASQNPVEDYAETTTALLVSGQSWYDNWVRTAGSAAGQVALRAKEQNVVSYFNNALGIDFKALQKEVQNYIKDSLKGSQLFTYTSFPYWINQGLYKTITVNLEDGMYTTYGISPNFKTAYDQYKAAVLALNPTAKYRLDYIQFRFDTPTSLVVRAAFTATAGNSTNTQYFGDYSFSVAVNSTNGETKFTKIAQGTGTTFNNGNLFMTSFASTIQRFLTESTFIADWLPSNTTPAMHTKTSGFYAKDNSANYFYGILGQ